MTPSTETWLISTISKRLERIAEGKEPMAEDRALTLLSILKDVAGDIPSLVSLPQHVKEWLEAAINARLDAIAEKREIAAEDRIATLTEALAALRPPASPGGSVERVDTGVGLSGGPITTTGTISLSTSSQQAIARANTSVQPEDLAAVATSGNYADLSNTPTIPEQFNPIQGANMLITGTYPNITFSAVAGEEFTPVWGEIQGTLADQTDLQDALDGKAPTVHTHTWGQITDTPVYTTRWPSWNEVTGKPAIPSSSDYVATSGDQSNLSGNKTWTGTHSFRTSSGIVDVYLGVGSSDTGGIFSDVGRTVVHTNDGYIGLRPAGRGSTAGELKVTAAGVTWSNNDVWHSGNFDPNSKANSSHTHAAGDITSGTFAAARIPNLNASKITAGTLNAARIPATLNETHFTGNITTSGSVIVADGTGIVQAGSLRSYSGAADISSVNAGGIRLMPNGWSTSNHTNIAANGNMTVRGTVSATNLTATSDPRLKDDIKRVKARRELIEKLEYWSFEWKKDGTKGRSVMADKVQEIAPEHVHVADDEIGTLSVDKGALALEMVFAIIDVLKEQELVEGEE